MVTLVAEVSRELVSRPQITWFKEVMAEDDLILSTASLGRRRMDMVRTRTSHVVAKRCGCLFHERRQYRRTVQVTNLRDGRGEAR